MASIHWATPDIAGDILAEAVRPDAARPVSVHVRPELHHLVAGRWHGIPLVVDDAIPAFPGYEVHRAVAPGRARRMRIRMTNDPVAPVEALLAA
jgi:hypothetical protein